MSIERGGTEGIRLLTLGSKTFLGKAGALKWRLVRIPLSCVNANLSEFIADSKPPHSGSSKLSKVV